jgi:hypothetical protein
LKKIKVRQVVGAIALILMAAIFIALNAGPGTGTELESYSQPEKVAIIVSLVAIYTWLVLFAVSKILMILGRKNPFALPSAIMWMVSSGILIATVFSITFSPTEPNTSFINLCCTLFLLVLPLVDVYDVLAQ